jgi:hypothetical protein
VTDDHPTPETLDRLLAGASTGEDSARALSHLAERCETCSRQVRGALARAGRFQLMPLSLTARFQALPEPSLWQSSDPTGGGAASWHEPSSASREPRPTRGASVLGAGWGWLTPVVMAIPVPAPSLR